MMTISQVYTLRVSLKGLSDLMQSPPAVCRLLAPGVTGAAWSGGHGWLPVASPTAGPFQLH